jgi:hypothetical protein
MTSFPSFPIRGRRRVFMSMLITTKGNALMGNALEAQLKSAEEERGRLVESVLARVGG